MGEVSRLSRARTLLMVALGVLVGGWIAVGRLATPPLLGWAALAAVGVTAAVMVAHPIALERRGLRGALALALLTGVSLMYGAVAVGRAADGVLPWMLIAWLQLVRTLVADIAPGRSGIVRLSAALALGFVPASLVLPVRAGYGLAYFLVAVFAQLTVLVAAARLVVGRMDRVDLLLKGAMVMVLVALVVGRVA